MATAPVAPTRPFHNYQAIYQYAKDMGWTEPEQLDDWLNQATGRTHWKEEIDSFDDDSEQIAMLVGAWKVRSRMRYNKTVSSSCFPFSTHC